MRSVNDPILAGLVLLFLLAHFLLLVGILMRIGARCWRGIVRVTGLCLSRPTCPFDFTNKRPGGSL